MTDFVVTITNPEQLAGITWAREQYNASLPPPPMPMPLDTVTGGMATTTMPATIRVDDADEQSQAEGTFNTDEEYVQWVMEQAAISYAVQQEQSQWRQAYEDAQAASRVQPQSRMRSG